MKSRNLWTGLLVLLAVTLAVAGPALAQDLPKSSNRVNLFPKDHAGVHPAGTEGGVFAEHRPGSRSPHVPRSFKAGVAEKGLSVGAGESIEIHIGNRVAGGGTGG